MRAIVLMALLLTACGRHLTPAEQARADERAIAEVEANQTPPPDQPTPQPIGYSQLAEAGISGSGCSFFPTGGTGDPIAFALVDEGFMKIDGKVERFAADSGSPATRYGTRARYDGHRYSMELAFDGGATVAAGMETTAHPAHLVLRDGAGAVYDAPGKAVCGA